MTQPTAVKRAAIPGAGTVGASWAAWFLARGMAQVCVGLSWDT